MTAPANPPSKEHDAMICRSCENEERASEGYPCQECGTFICVVCTNRGVILCKACAEKKGQPQPVGPKRK